MNFKDPFQELIRNQMRPFEGVRITTELLDCVEQSFPYLYREHFVRYSVIDGHLSYRAAIDKFPPYILERFTVMTEALNKLASSVSNLTFELYLGDGFSGWMKDCPAPVFAFSRHQLFDVRALLLPDPLTLSQGNDLRKQVLDGNAQHAWPNKIERAFWRGSTTGEWLTLEHYQRNIRFRLAALSTERPDCVDAGFTGFHPTCGLELTELVQGSGWMRPWTSISDHMRFKYLVLVDGFTSPWPRDFWSLHANSLVMKQRSDITSWFSELAIENVHFLPIAGDLSDICEVVEYARRNDDRARRITENANEFAGKVLAEPQIHRYIREFLSYYARFH